MLPGVMASVANIESAYYWATQAAKLKEPKGPLPRAYPYPKHMFEQWVSKQDIYTLGKEKADFYLDEDIVRKFEDYRGRVAAELAKSFQYDGIQLMGQTKNIGSCHDGSKIGKMNEVDSLYVISGDNIVVEHTDGIFRVILKHNSSSCEILPRPIRNQFATTYANVISKVPLPDCMKHAAYRSPDFSGIRYNGPAATSQFLAEDKNKEQRLLTWDMTPTVSISKEHGSHIETVREVMQTVLKINPDKMFGETNIHLFPDSSENDWRLSTAQLEADLLREIIPTVSPMKTALSYCKALASMLKTWNSNNFCFPLKSLKCTDFALEIAENLDHYIGHRKKTLGEKLNQVLQYAHIWIPPEKRNLYHEDDKVYISINTAAIKHILLATCLMQPVAFSGKENWDLVFQLMRLVFIKLGDQSKFSTPHAFLPGVTIPHLSVLSSQADKKLELALSIKEQCRMLVSRAMTKVKLYSYISGI